MNSETNSQSNQSSSGMQTRSMAAVINQNNSLVDSILVQITTASNSLLALNGALPQPQIAPSPASSASNASSTVLATERKIMHCMDKLPL